MTNTGFCTVFEKFLIFSQRFNFFIAVYTIFLVCSVYEWLFLQFFI